MYTRCGGFYTERRVGDAWEPAAGQTCIGNPPEVILGVGETVTRTVGAREVSGKLGYRGAVRYRLEGEVDYRTGFSIDSER